ncbi:hypothetical protein OK016_22065 [Vibrio chagasii]|nr:hypothetical protein [Vibrio chagasii]
MAQPRRLPLELRFLEVTDPPIAGSTSYSVNVKMAITISSEQTAG